MKIKPGRTLQLTLLFSKVILLALALQLMVGCIGDEGESLCDAAATHVAECMDSTPVYSECDAEAEAAAEIVLDQSCEELNNDGAADLFGDILCFFVDCRGWGEW